MGFEVRKIQNMDVQIINVIRNIDVFKQRFKWISNHVERLVNGADFSCMGQRISK